MFCVSPSRVKDDDQFSSGSPRRSSRGKDKNPYSNRGLDKFTALLTELEAKREKIMSRMGNQQVSLVRFVHKNSHEWVPIIVKEKDHTPLKGNAMEAEKRPARQVLEVGTGKVPGGPSSVASVSDSKMKKNFSWNLSKSGSSPSPWRAYYWALAMVLVLMCLVVFGRSFAIICTSIWWYLVPVIKGDDVNMRRSMKREYGRRLSEKRSSSKGTMEVPSPRHHLQGRK